MNVQKRNKTPAVGRACTWVYNHLLLLVRTTNEFSFIHHLDVFRLILMISGHPPLKHGLYMWISCAFLLSAVWRIFSLEGCVPDGVRTLAAAPMDLLDPIRRLADAAAAPVERRGAYVSRLSLPLTFCTIVTRKISSNIFQNLSEKMIYRCELSVIQKGRWYFKTKRRPSSLKEKWRRKDEMSNVPKDWWHMTNS